MARPLRIEFPGALYHVTSSRGDEREDIYLEEGDRQAWLGILGAVCERFREQVARMKQSEIRDYSICLSLPGIRCASSRATRCGTKGLEG
jgi:hypothetical protein